MSIRSMTGYGDAHFVVGGGGHRVEIRAVNHRHLDLRIRLPEELASMEPKIREVVRGAVSRGHLAISVSREDGGSGAKKLHLDLPYARRVWLALEELRGEFGLASAVSLEHLLTFDGVVQTVPRKEDPEPMWAALDAALGAALVDLDEMRVAEGDRLEVDLRARIDATEALAAAMRGALPQMLAEQKTRLERRLEELAGEMTPEWRQDRMEAEVALFADRSDVAEELTRIAAHLAAMRDLLAADVGTPCGRKLEFLAIELNRELNTVGSKVSSAAVAHQVVDAKTEVERIREQVANVE